MNKIFASIVALALGAMAASANAQEQAGYEAGVAARLAGRPTEARIMLKSWLQQHPEDVDAQLQLALTDLALGNLDAAEAGFRNVLAQAPDYVDAREGLAAVAARRAVPVAPAGPSLLIEGALSDLQGPASNWREVAVDVEVPAGTRATLGGRAAYFRRFGRDDVELVVRTGFHPSDDLWLRIFAGGTPKADFRPEIELGGGFDLRLSRGAATVLTFDAAYQRFPLQDVVMINPGVVQYLRGGNAWITLRGIASLVDGGPVEVGGLVRGDYVPKENWRLFGGVANGPDTDLGVVTRVTSAFGGLEAPVGHRFSLTGSLSREWRNSGPDRSEVRLGLRARF
ncbi:YaiO family outer membrane beta-barrel protein [Altererythrobacter aerius]|uniref:YaiO family outer membrane beta-barrel protein n=1 Tax=Tsuneonella aeria TaxID=1837929 RepID=A0A6I4TI88_9SPHN|nr:YaiO family outer membrane beta-barrel protein [Tsuneonella aeria]MXO75760.1 YaiO family outer membrane beta-barrel protein [Tsuneonella aeria]